jgi:hypothetical protein
MGLVYTKTEGGAGSQGDENESTSGGKKVQ